MVTPGIVQRGYFGLALGILCGWLGLRLRERFDWWAARLLWLRFAHWYSFPDV
jgi:hypothetical protein